jgi:hypothetical protein
MLFSYAMLTFTWFLLVYILILINLCKYDKKVTTHTLPDLCCTKQRSDDGTAVPKHVTLWYWNTILYCIFQNKSVVFDRQQYILLKSYLAGHTNVVVCTGPQEAMAQAYRNTV